MAATAAAVTAAVATAMAVTTVAAGTAGIDSADAIAITVTAPRAVRTALLAEGADGSAGLAYGPDRNDATND
jgi:hypothetical protein